MCALPAHRGSPVIPCKSHPTTDPNPSRSHALATAAVSRPLREVRRAALSHTGRERVSGCRSVPWRLEVRQHGMSPRGRPPLGDNLSRFELLKTDGRDLLTGPNAISRKIEPFRFLGEDFEDVVGGAVVFGEDGETVRARARRSAPTGAPRSSPPTWQHRSRTGHRRTCCVLKRRSAAKRPAPGCV